LDDLPKPRKWRCALAAVQSELPQRGEPTAAVAGLLTGGLGGERLFRVPTFAAKSRCMYLNQAVDRVGFIDANF
jgi:hypothetical protein